MTRQELLDVLNTGAQQRLGCVNGVEFGVDEGPFENSDCKFVAYHIGEYKGDFFFNTIDEFLNGFNINGKPIVQLLEQITLFKIVSCNN